MKAVYLKKNRHKRVESGHNWVFSNEIERLTDNPETGDIVLVRKTDGHFIGIGFYHAHSLISVRMLAREECEIDGTFFEERMRRAIQLRQQLYPETDAVRLVHSESDELPGLIVDRFKDVLSIQVHCAGMDQRMETVIGLLHDLLKPRAIIMRNESHLRQIEGLPLYKKISEGPDPVPPFNIVEHDLIYNVDVMEGQKTGFYIDQHDNRLLFRQFIQKGDHVLDAFCNEGGFAMNAAAADAGSVLAIDISEEVLKRGKINTKQNKLASKITFEKADLMKSIQEMSDTFDVINLDPPNFAQNKKSVPPAKRAYRKIHEAALKILKPGGIICTSCCSHHIYPEVFYQTMHEAAQSLGKQLRLLHRGGHPPDHPVLVGMPETEYLKFLVFQLIP